MSRHVPVAGLIVWLLSLSPGNAHHAPSIFDLEREVTLEGVVVAFEWVSPHTRVRLRADAVDGSEVEWTLEGMPPSYLGRRGWTRNTLAAGDRIEVVFFPRRDGTREGMFVRARLEDGTLRVMAISPPETAAE